MFQKEAIVKLLRDNDPATVNLLKEQLIETGSESVAALRDLLTLDDAAVTEHVREVLEKIVTDDAHDEMLIFAHLFPEHGDLEAAWWLLVRCFEPEAPVVKLRRKLDAWGRRLRMLVARAESNRERLQVLTTFLAEDLGFRGNAEEYYDPKNSMLNDLIETRLGIPISLAVLYSIIGRRAHMQIDGINLPGPFHRALRADFVRSVSWRPDFIAARLRGDPGAAAAEIAVELFRAGFAAADLHADAGESGFHFRADRGESKARAGHELAEGARSLKCAYEVSRLTRSARCAGASGLRLPVGANRAHRIAAREFRDPARSSA